MRRSRAALTISFVLLAAFLPAPPSTGSGDRIHVSPPQLEWGEFSPIPAFQYPTIWVNVTANSGIRNVTLYWIAFNGSISLPENLSSYNRNSTSLLLTKGNVSTYQIAFPRFGNLTYVYGAAVAFESNGTSVSSGIKEIYYVLTPRPATSLTLTLLVRDVNPQFLNVSLLAQGSFYNSYTYSGLTLTNQVGYYPSIDFTTQYASGLWYVSTQNVPTFYSTGNPRLFPFDHYNYTLDFHLPLYLNMSYITINGQKMVPGTNYVDYVGTTSTNYKTYQDVSQWSIQSFTTYSPLLTLKNGTTVPSEIRIVIVLNRASDFVNVLLITIFAMYALLGSSVFLYGKRELRNRLIIYLNIFVFSFSFFTAIRSLATVPSVVGLTMIERLGFALIPCTAVFAILTMVGIRTGWKRFADATAVVLGAGIVYYLAYFTQPVYSYNTVMRTYVTTQIPYGLFDFADLNSYGVEILVALFLGAAINLLLWVLRHRSELWLVPSRVKWLLSSTRS